MVRGKPKVGVGLNPGFGERPRTDLAGVLRDVKAAGFDGVEAGPLCDGNASAARAALDGHGLVQWSLHTGWSKSYRVDEEIEYLTALGGRFLTLSGIGSRREDGLRPYEEAADTLNRVGEQCRQAGLTFCYHNHGWEFRESDGVAGLDRLCKLTDPAVVKLCIDVFWAQYGGRDPVALVQQYLDRLAYLHLKDLRYVGPEPRRRGVLRPVYPTLPLNGEAEYVELGRGEVDIPGVWAVVAPLDDPWVVYEQDEAAIPAAEAAAISRRYLRERLGV
ncbi:MAG: sugar phosphate isomerase/epimerase [Dehalococcoidia bacterium]|nr:sugar phosphate isomerase/epimerase [Dehalococcoidia bacterium]